jgi:hypothetical protein
MVDNIYWEIPSSVDLEGFLKKHLPPFKYKIDHFYYIIDYISRGMEREDLDDNGGFVNINAAELQKANHNYKLYLDHLLKHHFLRTDMKYIVGKKSNLTNIKKELRNYITYNGEKLVNIDIKNSQPLFSTLLLDKTFWNKKGKLISIINTPLQPSPPSLINNTSSNPPSSNPYSFSITIIMIVELLESIDNKIFNQYKSFVNSGKFYEKVSKLLYPNSAFNKQKVKEMVYTVFFSSNRFIGQPEAQPKRDFKLNFPEVYEVFRLIKVKDHTLLARLLQRIESTIMIQHAAKRIAEEKPNRPIFTIHDSIATTVGNEDYVTSVIMEEVLKLTGLKVKLGKEYWG